MSQLPPSEVQRNPRSFDEFKFFNASEWLNILLFYNISIFNGILYFQYYQHWILLIELTHLSMKSEITQIDISWNDYLSLEFVNGVFNLYGEEYCSYNVHQLLHVSRCIRNWGPLPGYSCFLYESYLGSLKRSIHTGYRPIEKSINSSSAITSIKQKA